MIKNLPHTSGSEQGSNDPKAMMFERFAKKGHKRGSKKHGKRSSKRA